MNAMPQRWNDDKIDALGDKVDGLDRRFDGLERHVENGFNRLDARFAQVDARLDRLMLGLLGSATAIVVALLTAPHL